MLLTSSYAYPSWRKQGAEPKTGRGEALSPRGYKADSTRALCLSLVVFELELGLGLFVVLVLKSSWSSCWCGSAFELVFVWSEAGVAGVVQARVVHVWFSLRVWARVFGGFAFLG